MRLLKDMSNIVYRRNMDLNSVQTSRQVHQMDLQRIQRQH